jgi:hypothetical protein
MLKEILEQYPASDYHKYGEWNELYLREEDGKGCFKITGTVEQVEQTVNFILERFIYENKRQNTKDPGEIPGG